MRIPRFYQPGDLQPGHTFPLSDEVVQHVVRALRMRVGDVLELFNGDGHNYRACLTQVEKRRAHVMIESVSITAVESPLLVHIGQSVSRGERMDYAVQKATETGMAELTPLLSERCEVKLDAQRQAKRQQHWQQVVVSACEQSGRAVVPVINGFQSLDDWCAGVDAELKFVLHHHSAAPLGAYETPQSVALLIGPEGGLTEAEVERAMGHGFQPLALGPRVMRTETAPVAAQAVMHYLWGDLG
ncbi:MAG: 16S rRNA (uracil(1498)-N(3))-methyltransferase [Marinobacterium sp.]|nr:16S rRNA (uracil(1498)-N(3))-methyltransferase [Marinobacterium sp.]